MVGRVSRASKRQIRGLKIVGDHREVIPLQKALQVQVRREGGWKTVADVRDAPDKDIRVIFRQPVSTDAVRIFVPAADLPHSAQPEVDGIVRIRELLLIGEDGKEKTLEDWFGG